VKVRHVKDGTRISIQVPREIYTRLEEFASSNNMSTDVALTMILQYYLADDRARGVLEELANYFNKANRDWLASRVRLFLQDIDQELKQAFGEIEVENAQPELQHLFAKLNGNPFMDEATVASLEVPVVDESRGPWLSPSDNPPEDDF